MSLLIQRIVNLQNSLPKDVVMAVKGDEIALKIGLPTAAEERLLAGFPLTAVFKQDAGLDGL